MKARLKTREEMEDLLDDNEMFKGFIYQEDDNHIGFFEVLKFSEESGLIDQYISEHGWYLHNDFIVLDLYVAGKTVDHKIKEEVTKDNFIDSLHSLVNKYRKGILKITIDKKSQKFNGEWL